MSKLDNHLNIKQMALGGVSLAVLIAGASVSPANAAISQFIYGGGATFPERAYRDIMNCYGSHAAAKELEIGLTAHVCNTGDVGFTGPYKPLVQVLYIGVGSGNGKSALINHNAANWTNGNRTPDAVPVGATPDTGTRYDNGSVAGSIGSNWSANRGTNTPYPGVSFVGSDDPLLPSDLVGAGKYNANSTTNGWGPAVQVPALVGAVGIGYTPAAGTWNEQGVLPTAPIGTATRVSLRTPTWCGIYTGAITNWNDAEITADNGGLSITGGASASIIVHYRTDSGGTTFLFANALINQCADTSHPVPTSWQTATGNVLGVSNNSWFINVKNAIGLPSNFVGASGSGGVRTAINGTAGGVGYVSTDFLKPVDSGGPLAMNLQSWLSWDSGATPVFIQPNKKSAGAIMAAALPPSSAANSCIVNTVTYDPGTSKDGKCSHNPVNWGVTNPAPLAAGAYPIGGFSFMFAYSCYATVANGGVTTAPRMVATTGKLGYLRWYFGTTVENGSKVVNSLGKNGFGAIPASWRTAASTLMFTDKKTKIGAPAQTGTPCAAIPATPGKGA